MYKTKQQFTLSGITEVRKSNSVVLNCCLLKCWVDRQTSG